MPVAVTVCSRSSLSLSLPAPSHHAGLAEPCACAQRFVGCAGSPGERRLNTRTNQIRLSLAIWGSRTFESPCTGNGKSRLVREQRTRISGRVAFQALMLHMSSQKHHVWFTHRVHRSPKEIYKHGGRSRTPKLDAANRRFSLTFVGSWEESRPRVLNGLVTQVVWCRKKELPLVSLLVLLGAGDIFWSVERLEYGITHQEFILEVL